MIELTILFVFFAITLLMGIPVVFSLGIGAVASLIAMGDIPLVIITQKMFHGMDSFPLLCIPFFILAGEIMGRGKITDALLEFSILIVGRIRGGLALANVLASMFFGGITGSALADTSALGAIEIPMMVKGGYGKKFSTAITCASSLIGALIPPSVTVVIYCMVTGVSVGALFIAGIIPGLFLGLLLMLHAHVVAIRRKIPFKQERTSVKEIYISFKKVYPALLLPLIIVGGIIGGIFTPTEASTIAVLYAFIITFFIMKTIKLSDMPKLLINSAITTAVVLIILSTSAVCGWVIAVENVSGQMAKILEPMGVIAFLMMVNIFMIAMGGLIDTIPVIIIFAPTLASIAIKLGIDPIQFGMIICLNSIMGLATPPVGQALFIGCAIGRITLEELSKEIIPQLLIIFCVLILVTYFPPVTLYLPRLFGF